MVVKLGAGFKRSIEVELEELTAVKRVDDVYAPFEPQTTQERIAGLNGAIGTYEEVLEALNKDTVLEKLGFEDGE